MSDVQDTSKIWKKAKESEITYRSNLKGCPNGMDELHSKSKNFNTATFF